MRQLKLISGKMNIPYIRVKAGYALGAKRPKRSKIKTLDETPFNAPQLVIKLIKAA